MATEKLIDANEVKKKLRDVKEWFDGYPCNEQDKLAQAVAKMCIEEVKKIKPVDAVRVVRCKDCKWYQIRKWDDNAPVYDCRKTHAMLDVKPDDFCSYGEKRAKAGK